MRMVSMLAFTVLLASPAMAQYPSGPAEGMGKAGTSGTSGASQHMKDVLNNRLTRTEDKKYGAYAKRGKNSLPPVATPQ